MKNLVLAGVIIAPVVLGLTGVCSVTLVIGERGYAPIAVFTAAMGILPMLFAAVGVRATNGPNPFSEIVAGVGGLVSVVSGVVIAAASRGALDRWGYHGASGTWPEFAAVTGVLIVAGLALMAWTVTSYAQRHANN